MKAKRLLALARRHAQSGLSASCSHGPGSPPCDAALLAAEVARVRAWADFASDLLDAHLWGFGSGNGPVRRLGTGNGPGRLAGRRRPRAHRIRGRLAAGLAPRP